MLRSSLPISDTANLTTDLCIKGVFLEWLDGPGTRPEVGNLADLAFRCSLHHRLAGSEVVEALSIAAW